MRAPTRLPAFERIVMPWSDNSGNGGRGSAGGPWGQPPKSNGGGNGGGRGGRGEPPDLEELLQASRQRLKRAFPPRGRGRNGGAPGGGGPRRVDVTPRSIGVALLGVGALWFLGGWYQVGPEEQGVKTTFGKYAGISGSGLHWRAPLIQGVVKVPVKAQQTTTVGAAGGGASGGENLMLTSDRNIVDVTFTVNWKIKEAPTEPGAMPNAAKFIFNIENAQNLVRGVAESAMRETIGAKPLGPIITAGQADVVEQTRQRIQAGLDAYDSGIEVIRVNMERPEVPGAVRDAFADVIKARNEKAQSINDAQRAANQIVPVAEGEAQRMIEEARAYAAEVEATAIGEAERFNKIFEEYRRAKDVTKQRMYLETMEQVLGGMEKIMIDKQAGQGVVPYLPLNELGRPARPQN
jgi:membrane protease subunit HflK